ncbi:MAG: histidine triad nucleotide-binding protein [Candidatus Omnitrophica bacterium]|nr:histidine triad nucleotide-binding protein [Candidatus Omnitrophota bacterium]
MGDCIFCKIAKDEIESKIVYQDPDAVAFEDINPRAPVHIVIIPRKHIERISQVGKGDNALIGKLFFIATKLAREKNIESSGYRLVINCNKDAGQEVFHLHLHLLGGRKFAWPPG